MHFFFGEQTLRVLLGLQGDTDLCRRMREKYDVSNERERECVLCHEPVDQPPSARPTNQ